MSLIFESLEIENFKSFLGKHEFTFNRAPGLYYISGRNKLNPELGPNGVGKTTLWDALKWVLFNSTGRDNRPGAAVVPWGLEKGTCKVSLIFSINKKTYELVRSRRPNTLTLNYFDDEPKTVEQYQVEKRLGFSEQMFSRTIVLAQFGTFFLDLRPEQQSQMFSEALNLDVWLKASKVANSKHRQFVGELGALQLKASQQGGRLKELEASLVREEKAENAYDEKREETLDDLDKRIGISITKLDTLLRSCSGPTGTSQGGLAARGDTALAGLALKDAREGRAAAGKGGKDLAKALLADIATGEGSLRATGRERSALAGQLQGAERALSDCKGDVRQYEQAIKKDRRCPDCGQSVSVSHLKNKLAEGQIKIEKLNKECSTLSKQVAKLNKTIDDLELHLRALALILKKNDETLSDILGLWHQRDALESQKNPHGELSTDIKKRIRKLKAAIQEESLEIDKVEKQIGVCTYWVEAFKEIRLNLIDSILSELEIAVTQHAESLGLIDWRIEFQTERVKTSGEVATTFNTLLYPPDQEEAIKFESYSGGESQRWQLATAFGLSEIILARIGIAPNIEFYDEPTKGLSAEGIDFLLEHLRDRAKELGRAIYVSEHHSLDKGLFDAVITIEKTEKGSRIKE